MTILIKGMEMPETCYKCKFALARFDPLPTQKYKRHDFECVLTEKALTSTKRNKACPLIEVPTPHGRLGDLDRLYKHIKAECNIYGKPTIGEEDGNKVLKIIANRRTFIEAEE